MLDILINNGQYPDFERAEWITQNVGIKDGKIVFLGLEERQAKEVIDAKGKIISPGFIDIHMHEEDFIPEGKRYIIAEMMLQMGVTTCLGGNCGLQKQDLKDFKHIISELGGAPVNYLMLAGYNTFRAEAAGHYEKTTREQRLAFREKLKSQIEEGACGISFGIEYDPAMDIEEILFALEAFSDDNLLVSVHGRKAGKYAISAVEEMLAIAGSLKKKFQISHLSSCAAMGKMDEALELINNAIEKNPRINYDTYPYNAFSTYIGSAVFADGCFERWGKDHSAVLLTEAPYKDQFCDEALFYKARKEHPQMLAVVFAMNEAEIAKAISNPYGMVASDAIINNGKGHPRAAGTFPRLLGKYVRDDNIISLSGGLRKITLEPARRLDLNEKGKIAVGCDGDIVVFDPENIKDGATYSDLNINPVGIDYVIVDGKVAIDHTKVVDDRAGRFLSYNEAKMSPPL